MKSAKKFVKKVFNILGLEISRIPTPPPSPLLYHRIELLFDVGANVGQFALERRAEGYRGKIVSFEPLPDAHERILKASEDDPLWIIHKRCAVGSNIGEVEINISRNSYSSSILPMLEAHSTAAPESLYIGKAKTPVVTLDSVFDAYRTRNERTFLKIDTQGFESEVLKGSSNSLKNIQIVQLELSIVPLYEGQCLYKYFFAFFEENGFTLWAIIPGFQNPITGQHLQFDALFVRK